MTCPACVSLDDERFFHLDIESVSRDPEMKELRKCCEFAGISGILDLDAWLKLCRKHCLWNMGECSHPLKRVG